MVLEQQFSWNCFKNNSIFFHLPSTSSHFLPLQVENCDSNSRLVVDEDDTGKLRLERGKYHLLNMLKIKCDINQQYLKTVDLHFVKSE